MWSSCRQVHLVWRTGGNESSTIHIERTLLALKATDDSDPWLEARLFVVVDAIDEDAASF